MIELEELKKENQSLREKIKILEGKINSQRKGMEIKAEKGKHMSRAPFGYSWEKEKLVPNADSKKVEEIFLDFKNSEKTLNTLSKKHGFSINGLKKILSNFTYLGKIKFGGEIHEGKHLPIISPILFNQVQDKLEKIYFKK